MTSSEIDHVARAGLLLKGYPVHPEDFQDANAYVAAVRRDDYAEADRLLGVRRYGAVCHGRSYHGLDSEVP